MAVRASRRQGQFGPYDRRPSVARYVGVEENFLPEVVAFKGLVKVPGKS